MNLGYKIAFELKKHSSGILCGLSVVGLVTTVYSAINETPKALELARENPDDKGIDKIISVLPAYKKTIVIGLSTTAVIVSNHFLNEKKQQGLSSAYLMLDQAYKDLYRRTEYVCGREKGLEIKREQIYEAELNETPYDNECRFFEEYSNTFFNRTIESVIEAEYRLNRLFQLRGYVTLNDFYKYLDLPEVSFGDVMGWSLDAGAEFYGYSWIDFYHEKVSIDDTECRIIQMPYRPTTDFSDFH